MFKYVYQIHNSDLSASFVDIQLDINQLNFRLYIEMIQNRIESVAPLPRS